MSKFTYDDIVRVVGRAMLPGRENEHAWIVGVAADRMRWKLPQFPDGIVYTIEFEDGSSCDMHEDDLELLSPGSGTRDLSRDR